MRRPALKNSAGPRGAWSGGSYGSVKPKRGRAYNMAKKSDENISDDAATSGGAEKLSIEKPRSAFRMEDFRATRSEETAEISREPTPLAVLRAPHVEDFIRLHPDEENFWSIEM